LRVNTTVTSGEHDAYDQSYVSRQLGHKDSAITLKVYARWLQDHSRRRGGDRLDETQPSAPRAS